MSKPTSPAYKTRNWPAYNEALKRRGSLTIWFDPAMTWAAAPTGKRGRQPDYSGEEDQKTVWGTVFPTTHGTTGGAERQIPQFVCYPATHVYMRERAIPIGRFSPASLRSSQPCHGPRTDGGTMARCILIRPDRPGD